jgi:hypothetical protein
VAFFNKAEKGAVQRAKTGSATTASKAEKGAVQGGYSVSGTLSISKSESITLTTTATITGAVNIVATQAVAVATAPLLIVSDPQVVALDAVSVADTGTAYFMFNVAASDAVTVTDTPAAETAPADLSIGILWEDLTLWVQGVKVSGA